jgi:predicted Zn-dependent protease
MDDELKQLNALCRAARRDGALGLELLHEQWSGHRVEATGGRVTSSEDVGGSRLWATAWLEGGRCGRADGTDGDAEGLIQTALNHAEAAPPDPHAGPAARLAGVMRGLGIADRRFDTIEEEHRHSVPLMAERTARAVDRRVVPGRFWYEDRSTLRSFANSRDVLLQEPQTWYRAGGQVSGAGSEETLAQQVDARTFASIASLPLGTNVGRILQGQMKRGETLYGAARVLLWPEAVGSLFAHLALAIADTDRYPELFLRTREEPLHKKLHMVDDGTRPGGLRTTSFDDRGVRPAPLVLLREGVLGDEVMDLERARRAERPATGHARRGSVRPHNLALRSGSRSVNAVLADHDGWCISIHQLPDLNDALDLKTGQLSGRVSGAIYKGSKHVGAVRGGMLQGDLGQVLSSVYEVCSNTDRVGHVDAPAILVDGFELVPA